jgi:hypothetical protein
LFNGWSSEYATQVRDYCWRTFMERYRRTEFLSLLLYRIAPPLLEALRPIHLLRDESESEAGAESNSAALTIFSGHDAVPVLPVLIGLGLWQGKWPDYSSLLALEVWK